MRAGALGTEDWGGAGQRTRESLTRRLHRGLTLQEGLEKRPLLKRLKESARPLHYREPTVLRTTDSRWRLREAARVTFTPATELSLGRGCRQGSAPSRQRPEPRVVGGQGSRELRARPGGQEDHRHCAWKVLGRCAPWVPSKSTKTRGHCGIDPHPACREARWVFPYGPLTNGYSQCTDCQPGTKPSGQRPRP